LAHAENSCDGGPDYAGAKESPRPGTKDDGETSIACRFARVKPLA
jgi:hypothetical protein